MGILKTLNFISNHPLNRNNKTRAIIKYLKWQISSLLSSYQIIYPFTEKSKLIISKGMTGATGNLYCGLHEFSEMSFLLHFIRVDDLFIDIGANIGSYTVLASAHVGAKTISFEPVPSTYSILLQNIAVNNIIDKVTAYNKAIGNKNEVIKFTRNLDTVNHAATNDDNDTIDVEICQLDDVLSNKMPALLKIDVEGYETEVINGAEETLKKDSLKAIIIELNGSGNRYGYDDEKIHNNLIDFGFIPYIYKPFERQLIKAEHFGKNNTIYIKDFNFVNQRILSANKININNHLY